MSDCPVEKCGATIPSDRLMCRPHWFQCPRELRDELWRAIRRFGWLSDEAGLARGECIRAVNERQSRGNLGATPPGAARRVEPDRSSGSTPPTTTQLPLEGT